MILTTKEFSLLLVNWPVGTKFVIGDATENILMKAKDCQIVCLSSGRIFPASELPVGDIQVRIANIRLGALSEPVGK
jgi:hypothetical protein